MLIGRKLTEPNEYVDIVKVMGIRQIVCLNSERMLSASGPKCILNTNCLKKTKYEFGAGIKLQSMSGLHVSCKRILRLMTTRTVQQFVSNMLAPPKFFCSFEGLKLVYRSILTMLVFLNMYHLKVIVRI